MLSGAYFLSLGSNAKNVIKPGEQVAIEYFRSKGYTDIVHEPNGNVPPDLLINGSIAVEVRRLNQFKNTNGIYSPLEELEYALMPRVKKIIASFAQGPSDLTSYVSVDFSRPLRINQALMSDITAVLETHLEFLNAKGEYQVRANLSLRFWPTKKQYGKPYVWASSSDGDGGGFALSNILTSLKIIIAEKQEKIFPYKSKYCTWWLVVNDRIGFGMDEIDLSQLQAAFNIPTFFERVIFISPFNSLEGSELHVPDHMKI